VHGQEIPSQPGLVSFWESLPHPTPGGRRKEGGRGVAAPRGPAIGERKAWGRVVSQGGERGRSARRELAAGPRSALGWGGGSGPGGRKRGGVGLGLRAKNPGRDEGFPFLLFF